jgi:hypothetical protein
VSPRTPRRDAPNTRAWTAPLSALAPSTGSTVWTRPLGPVALPVAPPRRKPRLPPIDVAVGLWDGRVGRA